MPSANFCFVAPAKPLQRTSAVLVLIVSALHSLPQAGATETTAMVPLVSSVQRASDEAARLEIEIVNSRAGIICPVDATTSFFNDFGDGRSGGRSHEGTDIMSDAGVPLVAVVDGTISNKYGGLAGNSVYLLGDDGNEYWYFHVDEYVGEPRAVKVGEVIATAGASGNAQGIHTHFEIHPSADPYDVINPYDKLDLVCRDRVPVR